MAAVKNRFDNPRHLSETAIVEAMDECIGCQTCVELCPDVFDFDNETDKAFVRDDATGREGCIEGAADACPASCINIEEA